MTRDRLAALHAARSDDEDDMDEIQLNMETRDGFMDEFFKEIEELRKKVDQLQADMEQVKKVQSDILSSPTTDEKMQQQLNDLNAAIKKSLNQVRSKLKSIEQSIEQAEQYSESPADIRIRKTQHATLSKKFVELMTEYNATQLSYKDKCKERMIRQIENTGQRVTEDEVDRMLEEGSSAVLTQGIVTDTQQARQTLADIEARHADIIQLENSIRELHGMFVDMAVLVESQGELIDRIEYQVDQAVDYVDRANRDMKQAREYANKARKKKLMILACLVVTGCIMASTVAGYLGL